MKLLLKNSLLVLGFCLTLPCFADNGRIDHLGDGKHTEAEVLDNSKDYRPWPQPGTGYVTDHAGLLTKQEEERIEYWLWQVEYRSKVEIIVMTIDSMSDYPGTQNNSIESFATGLFDTYGIGNMPNNDGVLLLISKKDRKARIELGAGYGHYRNADAERIMQEVIVPAFRQGNYVEGITDGTEAIILEFANMKIGFPWYIVWVGLSGLVCLLIGLSLLKSGKRGWGYVFIGLAIVLVLLAIYLAVRFVKQLPDSSSDSWSAGGGGGFGGGFSGGGGATGSW